MNSVEHLFNTFENKNTFKSIENFLLSYQYSMEGFGEKFIEGVKKFFKKIIEFFSNIGKHIMNFFSKMFAKIRSIFASKDIDKIVEKLEKGETLNEYNGKKISIAKFIVEDKLIERKRITDMINQVMEYSKTFNSFLIEKFKEYQKIYSESKFQKVISYLKSLQSEYVDSTMNIDKLSNDQIKDLHMDDIKFSFSVRDKLIQEINEKAFSLLENCIYNVKDSNKDLENYLYKFSSVFSGSALGEIYSYFLNKNCGKISMSETVTIEFKQINNEQFRNYIKESKKTVEEINNLQRQAAVYTKTINELSSMIKKDTGKYIDLMGEFLDSVNSTLKDKSVSESTVKQVRNSIQSLVSHPQQILKIFTTGVLVFRNVYESYIAFFSTYSKEVIDSFKRAIEK